MNVVPSKKPSATPTNLLRDTRGANLVEYIILVGVIALIAIAGFKTFGSRVTEKVQQQSDTIGAINGTTN